MNILVINAGSSSLKYQLINTNDETVVAKGICERIGADRSVLKHKKTGAQEVQILKEMPNHKTAIEMVLAALVDPVYGAVKSMNEIGAVGHRMVHSGEDFNCSVLVDDKVMEICKANTELAPLHQPANIMGVEACKAVLPSVPMALVFDTAFHSTMPEYAYMYAIPYEDYKKYKIRRYGFHGTSHMFVANETAKYLNKDIKDLKIITCHLGNGSSITAVDGGKSVDTSMGFTPLEGLPMGTRCGDIDPAVIEFLMNKTGESAHQTLDYLNKKSGMLGLSGISSDFRDLTANAEKGDARCELALDVFSYAVKKFIGSYVAVMNGVDVVVFTAGVGENTHEVREKVCKNMSYLGIEMDFDANKQDIRGVIRELSAKNSKVKVLIVPTNEELVIARETLALIK